jgi:hypothetical protein
MTIKAMQDRLDEMFKRRKRSKKVGISIFVPADIKEKRRREMQADSYMAQSAANRRIGK